MHPPVFPGALERMPGRRAVVNPGRSRQTARPPTGSGDHQDRISYPPRETGAKRADFVVPPRTTGDVESRSTKPPMKSGDLLAGLVDPPNKSGDTKRRFEKPPEIPVAIHSHPWAAPDGDGGTRKGARRTLASPDGPIDGSWKSISTPEPHPALFPHALNPVSPPSPASTSPPRNRPALP